MLTLYGFYLPYKDVKVNVIEILVELNATLLLLLVSSGILESLYSLPLQNSVSANEPCRPTRGVAVATWILLPLYYLPLLLLLIFISAVLIIR